MPSRPSDKERLAVIETKLTTGERWMESAEKRFDKFDEKLDKLLEADNQRKGRERARHTAVALGSGFLGAFITGLLDYFRH